MNAAEWRPEPISDRRQPTARRKALYYSVMVLVLLLLAEGSARVALRVSYGPPLPESERLHEYDPELGWVNMKDRRALNRFGSNKHATHNSLGLRATRGYTTAVPEGRYRVIFLGDSLTYGVDAGDADTFVARLESLAPSLEAVNMGIAGYGIHQMYLWYKRQGTKFAIDMLVLAFIEDDFRRMKLRSHLTQNPKPRLFLNGNAITVSNVPVPTWGVSAKNGWLEEFPNRTALVQILRSIYDMFLQNYDPLPVAENVFADLNELSQQKKQRFVLVYLPSKTDMERAERTVVATKIQEFAERNRIPFFDLTNIMKAAMKEVGPLFVEDGVHYSETGNKAVAQTLLSGLGKQFPEIPRPTAIQ